MSSPVLAAATTPAASAHAANTSPRRRVMCYTCAVRISTMPISSVCPTYADLPTTAVSADGDSSIHTAAATAIAYPPRRHTFSPPPTPAEVFAASSTLTTSSVGGASSLPVTPIAFKVTNYHPLFDIVYEHPAAHEALLAADRRQFYQAASESDATDSGALTLNTYAIAAGHFGSPPQAAPSSPSSSDLMADRCCCACRGLYQLLDHVYVPRAAEAVRRSPYLDSKEISVNINVCRGMSFMWLAAAAEFLRGAVGTLRQWSDFQQQKLSSEQSAATSTVPATTAAPTGRFPEDYASFKDLYTPDVRARMMARLSVADAHSSDSAASAVVAGQKRPREEDEEEEETTVPSTSSLSSSSSVVPVFGTVPLALGACDVPFVPPPQRPRCRQAFGYAHMSTCGVIVEINATHAIAEALTGEAASAANTGSGSGTIAGRRAHEDAKERLSAVLPKEWCTNKGAAMGAPLPLFILDDFVLPYLVAQDPVWSRDPTCHREDGKAYAWSAKDDAWVPRKADAEAIASSSQIPHVQWACFHDRTGEGAVAPLATPIVITNDEGSSGFSSSSSSLLAPIDCTVKHANLYIVGKYNKYVRGMSQSPWFTGDARIGQYPLSLQEYIADPILALFFPFGIPAAVPPSGTNAAKEQQRALAASASASAPQAPPSSEGGARDTTYLSARRAEQNRSRVGQADRPQDDDDNAVNADATSALPPQSSEGAASSASPIFKKYLGTPYQAVDPVLIAMARVKGYGHYRFHTAGREDVDVRMLGTGRPFVLEIISPQRESVDLAALPAHVDAFFGAEGLIQVVGDLHHTSADITVTMAKHSAEKRKVYRSIVYSSRAIRSDADPLLVAAAAMRDIEVMQTTPMRVLHRRSLLSRPKMIHKMTFERINDHWLQVDLETQAGTYIKEFVHGDMGRTLPSLGTLLDSRTDIIQLDVLGMSELQ